MNNLRPYESEAVSIEGIEHSALIRTGVPGDGSCYFHTIAYAMDWKGYSQSIDKKTHIQQMRQEFSSQLTLPYLRQSTYHTYIPMWVNNVMQFLRDNPHPSNTDIHNFVRRKYTEHKNLETTICTEDIFHSFTQFLTQTHLFDAPDKIDPLRFEEIYLDHIRCTLNIYTYWPDAVSLLPYTAHFLRTNIFLVQEKGGIIHPIMHSGSQYRKNIVILHVNESHFECIGVEEEGKNTYLLDRTHTLTRQLIEQSAPFTGMTGGFEMGSSISTTSLTVRIVYVVCFLWFIVYVVYATHAFLRVYVDPSTVPQNVYPVELGFVFLIVWWVYYSIVYRITHRTSFVALGCLLLGYTTYRQSIAYIPTDPTETLSPHYTLLFTVSVASTVCGIWSTFVFMREQGARELPLFQWIHVTVLTVLFCMYI